MDAVAFGFAWEQHDERADDEAAERGDQQPRPPGQRARQREGIRRFGEPAFAEEVREAVRAREEDTREEADPDAEDDGGKRAAEPACHRHAHQERAGSGRAVVAESS